MKRQEVQGVVLPAGEKELFTCRQTVILLTISFIVACVVCSVARYGVEHFELGTNILRGLQR